MSIRSWLRIWGILRSTYACATALFQVGLNNVGVILIRDYARECSMVNYNSNVKVSQCVVAISRVSRLVQFKGILRRIALRVMWHIPSRIERFILVTIKAGLRGFYIGSTRAVHVTFFKVATRRLLTCASTRCQLSRFLSCFIGLPFA